MAESRHPDDVTLSDRMAGLEPRDPTTIMGPAGQIRYFNTPKAGTVAQYFWWASCTPPLKRLWLRAPVLHGARCAAHNASPCSSHRPADGKARAVVMLLHGHGANIQFEYLRPHVSASHSTARHRGLEHTCLAPVAPPPHNIWPERPPSPHSATPAAAAPCQGPGRPKTYEGSWVQALNRAGCSVTGVDMPGCGRSEGLFGYVDDFQRDYVGTAIRHARCVAAASSHAVLPWPAWGAFVRTAGLGAGRGAHPPSGPPQLAPRGLAPPACDARPCSQARMCLRPGCRLVREGKDAAFAGLPVFAMGTSLGGCIASHAALREPDLFAGLILIAPMLSLEKVARSGLNPYLR